jgi:hypothetical protein
MFAKLTTFKYEKHELYLACLLSIRLPLIVSQKPYTERWIHTSRILFLRTPGPRNLELRASLSASLRICDRNILRPSPWRLVYPVRHVPENKNSHPFQSCGAMLGKLISVHEWYICCCVFSVNACVPRRRLSLRWVTALFRTTSFPMMYPVWKTRCRGRVVNSSATYLGGPGFKSQTGNWLSWLWFFVISSVPPGKCRDSTLS